MDGDSEPVFAGQPPAAIGHLVRCWFPDACVRRPLAGGFSGGGVWLVEAAGGRFVLKVFPRGTSLERGRWIHAAMLRARAAGLAEVPAAVPAQDGDSLLASDGRLWEMVSFVDGQPASRPTAARWQRLWRRSQTCIAREPSRLRGGNRLRFGSGLQRRGA